MAEFPFVGASYTTRTKRFDAQRSVNLYPEISESGNSRTVAALYGTPGLALWKNLAGGVVRGMLRVSAAYAIAVVGGNVYRLDSAANATLIGTIVVDTAPVSMQYNGQAVMIVTGLYGYSIDLTTWVLTQITDAAFTGADRVDFIDGYFVFNKPGTGQFQITQLYSTAIDSLDFATAEGSPDLLVSLIVDHRELWLFGENSTEVFYNSGNTDFPFERINGAFLEVGCAAKNSVAKLDNTVFWLSADNRGEGMIFRAQGYQPQRISTHAVEYAITQYSRIDDAVAYTYQQDGHSFYVLTFPTANATWVFDASTNQWHERAWLNTLTGQLNRHRSQCQVFFAGENLVGDWENGNIYRLDLDTYSDNGNPLPRIRRCMHIANDAKRQFHRSLEILLESGVGLPSGQGSDPQAMLRWSDDGGFAWSSEHWTTMGKIGERSTRVIYRRLGNVRDRVYELKITDPVKVAIIGATLDVDGGRS